MGCAKLPPVSCQRRRLEYFAHECTPSRADLCTADKVWPVAHRLGRYLQTAEQDRQLMLRMARFLAHQIPVFHRPAIQPRQHDMPVRQVGNGGDQFTRGSKGAGRSGNHHQLFGRMVAPQPATQPDKPVAPVGGVDHTLLFKNGGPAVDQDGQQFQDVLPVPRKPVGKKLEKKLRRRIRIAEGIKEPAERLGKLHGLWLGRCHVAKAEAAKQARQPQLAAQRVHRRRQVGRVGGKSQQVGRILLDITNRVDPGQQGCIVTANFKKGRTQGLCGTARGHQHGGTRQRFRATGQMPDAGGE